VPRDAALAVAHYRRAADAGMPVARRWLAELYARAHTRARAHAYTHTRARAHTHRYRLGWGLAAAAVADAIALVRDAALDGSADAQYELGYAAAAQTDWHATTERCDAR
jgi:TPR repeat protein